jgi:uncharacterized ParB-like nuclease family protein
MTKALITESYLTAIADAIRAQTGKTGKLQPSAMAAEIASIEGGGGSKLGVEIDDVIGDVNSSHVYQLPTHSKALVMPGFTSVASYGLAYKFWRNTGITSAEFSDLTTLSTTQAMSYSLAYDTHLTSISFPELTTISGNTACQYLCINCAALESASFPELKTIGISTNSANARHFYYAFNGCTKLTELHFPALETIHCNGTSAAYGTFAYCNKVQKVYLPKCTTIDKASAYSNATAAKNVFSNCTSLTEIHFSASNQAAIEASPGYATKWGAPSSCSIIFDEEAPEGYESLTLTVGSGAYGPYTMKGFLSEASAAEEGMAGFGSVSPASIGGQEIQNITAVLVGSSAIGGFLPKSLSLMLKSDKTLDKDGIAQVLAAAVDGDVLEFWAKIG